MNIKKIEILITYLESLPQGYKHFSMQEFCTADHSVFDIKDDYTPECGHHLCLAGHMALCPELKEDLKQATSWLDLSRRVTGISSVVDPRWDFMFSELWVPFDNSLAGGITRLKEVVRNPGPADYEIYDAYGMQRVAKAHWVREGKHLSIEPSVSEQAIISASRAYLRKEIPLELLRQNDHNLDVFLKYYRPEGSSSNPITVMDDIRKLADNS